MELKQGKGYLYFDGDVRYHTLKSDSITHNGKTYTSREFVEVKTTCSDLLEAHKDWIKYRVIEFPEIDYKIKIQELTYFSDGLSSLMNPVYSENYYVNLSVTAFRSGLLDKRILNVSTCKTDYLDRLGSPYKDQENLKRILDNMSLDIELKRYGFNNSLYYTISLETLFYLPYENIPKDIIQFFKRNGFSFKSNNKTLQAINLLNKKIQHETRKQQITNSFSF